MDVRGFCVFAALLLSSSVAGALDNSTPARAFADYVDALSRCDRHKLEEIVHELPDNFHTNSCNLEIKRKITHIMMIDDVTIKFICFECKRAPKFGDHMVFSIRKEAEFDWEKCSHLFREFDEGWRLISWSCGDHH